MRVVHILRKLDPAQWGGTEMAIQRLFEGLREQGASPVIYCPRLAAHRDRDPLDARGFEVRRFKAFVPIMGISAARKRQLVSVGGNLMSFELFRMLQRERQAQLIHAHTLGRLGGIALTAAKRLKVPFVVTIHGGVYDLPETLKESFNQRETGGWEWGRAFGVLFQSRNLFRDADAILTCNTNEAALLSQRYPSKKVVVQPHGVPLALFQKDNREAAQGAFPQIQGRTVILSLGRIDPVKNQAWLIRQAPRILDRFPQALLVLAGPCTDEPYGQLVEGRIRRMGLEDKVLLTGGLASGDPRLIGLLQSASVLVLPSVSETFGLVILEAWAAGLPVLCSRTSGATALVKDGYNGRLFDLSDLERFHQALGEILSRPDNARDAAARGTERVREDFSIQAVAARLHKLYQELVEQRTSLRMTSSPGRISGRQAEAVLPLTQ